MPPIEATESAQPVVEEFKQPKIGIIYPPPEVRNIVDKTASFVARNGPEFESRIRQNEINNPKFNFLNPTDPYHAYYQHKVKDFSEGRAVEGTALKVTVPSAARLTQETPKAIQEAFIPKEPPTDFEFVADPPSIKALDLDIVKLTAQFVARNGRQFLTQLMNREQRNYLFDFLRPQHGLFNYFTKLVEQYTKILIPPKDLISTLQKEGEKIEPVMEQVRYRVEWHRFQEKQKKHEEEATERERVAYAIIDWHDFVVVETVDFQPQETGNFPLPTTPEEVGARVLAEERKSKLPQPPTREFANVDLDSGLEEDELEAGEEDEEEAVMKEANEDMEQSDEEESDEEAENDKASSDEEIQKLPPPPPPPQIPEIGLIPPPPGGSPPPPPLIPPPPQPPSLPNLIRPILQPPTSVDQMLIRRDYDPKAPKAIGASGEEVYLVSPFTGERIPASQVPKHVRIGLLDQKWIEQRDREVREKKDEEQVFATGHLIESSLKQLAERRTDIFGVGVDETVIGRKLGEEENRSDEVIWDGHSGTMAAVSKKAIESVTAEQQKERQDWQRQQEQEQEKTNPLKPPPAPPAQIAAVVQPPPIPPPPPHTQPAQVFVPPPPPPQRPVMMSAPQNIQPPQGMPAGMQPPRHMMMQLGRPMPPPPPTFLPQMAFQPNQVPSMQQPSISQSMGAFEEEPPSKKLRTEDSLIPEDQYLRTHKSPLTFRVLVPGPVIDKPEWRLSNQILTFTLPLTETVATLKGLIAEKLVIPVGKQKLQLDGLFLKDNYTLAYYNFSAGMPVQLFPKERGGRRK